MNLKFNVTYEDWTETDIEAGECNDTGFLLKNVNLREALEEFRPFGYHVEADCWPVSLTRPPRWFSLTDEANYRTGVQQTRSLHLPRNISPSSALRIARLVGCKVS